MNKNNQNIKCHASDSNQQVTLRVGNHEKHFQWGKQRNIKYPLEGLIKVSDSL